MFICRDKLIFLFPRTNIFIRNGILQSALEMVKINNPHLIWIVPDGPGIKKTFIVAGKNYEKDFITHFGADWYPI